MIEVDLNFQEIFKSKSCLEGVVVTGLPCIESNLVKYKDRFTER